MNFGVLRRPRKHLTKNMKIKLLSYVPKRDKDFDCLFCKLPLKIKSYVNEHLNSDRRYNRPENISFSCQSCNIKKINSPEMQKIALEKLEENERLQKFMSDKKIKNENLVEETSTEIEINETNSDITEHYITEKIEEHGSIPFKDTLNSLVYICKKRTSHGSQPAVRNYIAYLSSPEAPFEIVRDKNGRKIIVRRCN